MRSASRGESWFSLKEIKQSVAGFSDLSDVDRWIDEHR
jgi:hypothetical protein